MKNSPQNAISPPEAVGPHSRKKVKKMDLPHKPCTFSNSFDLSNTGSQLRLGSGRTLTFGEGLLTDSNNGTEANGT